MNDEMIEREKDKYLIIFLFHDVREKKCDNASCGDYKSELRMR